ncbi:SRPBCC family protein [Nocardiopsis eucommiae]|uniref:SRPBCC family protein n=1 Tax=Nocardiopsis eucommiae TaxID=2831970 RepID=UPI003D70248E
MPAAPLGNPERTAMKYTVSIEIALPRERVARLLSDPEHLPKWLRGLVLHEPRNGVHGQVGTVSRVVLRTGRQEMECTETITRREPADPHGIPAEDVVHYEREIVTEGMWSAVRDRLTEAGPGRTLWVSENEYRFSGVMMRLVGFLMPGAFRKQSLQHMRDFRAFAERGEDVRAARG